MGAGGPEEWGALAWGEAQEPGVARARWQEGQMGKEEAGEVDQASTRRLGTGVPARSLGDGVMV